MQLEWARHIPGRVIVACPLSVAQQTVRESAKLNLESVFEREPESDARIVVIHSGSPVGHSSYAGKAAQVHADWLRNMQALEAQIKQARSGAKISYVDGALLSLNAAAPATVGAAPAARPAAIEHF